MAFQLGSHALIWAQLQWCRSAQLKAMGMPCRCLRDHTCELVSYRRKKDQLQHPAEAHRNAGCGSSTRTWPRQMDRVGIGLSTVKGLSTDGLGWGAWSTSSTDSRRRPCYWQSSCEGRNLLIRNIRSYNVSLQKQKHQSLAHPDRLVPQAQECMMDETISLYSIQSIQFTCTCLFDSLLCGRSAYQC